MPPCHGGDREFDPRLDRHSCRCGLMVEHDLAKVNAGVRFSSPAPLTNIVIEKMTFFIIFLQLRLQIQYSCANILQHGPVV